MHCTYRVYTIKTSASCDYAIGHASGNENVSFDPLFMIHNDVIGHLIRHFSMENHYKLS